ncbi:GDP-mannose transporter into the lumen of the Golgi [Nowakowskiella sp. JEL0078]|nr:GDP-mannose transporter into the lumen of the Golgi [Nowakowskiella sp. JEL0078]
MIYTGSKAIQYLSIPVFTIFKNLTIILIAYSELIYFNGTPVTRLIFSSFFMMVMSSVIAGWADLAQGKAMKESANTVGPLVSYSWMLLNCFTSAFFALFMRSKIKEVGFKDFDTVFYNNLLSIPVLLGLSFVLEQHQFAEFQIKYFSGNPGDSGFTALCVAVLVSGVSGFAISYGSTWCVRVTSSTTYSMVGALNKLPIAIAGMLFFEDAQVSFANNKQKNESMRVLPVVRQDLRDEKDELLFEATEPEREKPRD